MIASSFWQSLPKPIIGPAPMDGVTDAAFRYITDTYGHPDILVTEFVNVEAIDRGGIKVLNGFIHHKTKTPTIAQVFGNTPESFYKAAISAAEMGFDGIDINMGCPDKNVVKHGGGAGLIRKPKLAQQIVKTVRQALHDWQNGKSINDISLNEIFITFVKKYNQANQQKVQRKYLPVSLKTRIGYDKVITEDWISNLIEVKPDAISLHGRTLKQMYSGIADWNEIAKASRLCSQANILFLGNGDVKSVSDAKEKAKKYKTQGILIGRASLGNPWIFSQHIPTLNERFAVLLEHAHKFHEYRPDLSLMPMRKHFTWYCKGFDHSAVLRNELMKVKIFGELEALLNNYKKTNSVTFDNGANRVSG